MKKSGGAIVNVSSLAARCATAGRSTLYGPLKAAVAQLSVMFGAEYAAFHIRVNSVLPGFTLTPAVKRTISEEELAQRAYGTLLQRPAEPGEIADPIVFLCSDRSSYITAASLEVSGGSSVVLNPAYSYDLLKKGQY
jgi:NAD(P)-dependent dehydrogenase (short-subunit alcohol dehydrogenase family)